MTSKRGAGAGSGAGRNCAARCFYRGEQRKPVLGRPFPLGVSGNPAGHPLGSATS
jgi:hypothetical protein